MGDVLPYYFTGENMSGGMSRVNVWIPSYIGLQSAITGILI